jgi:hypothetical protein
MRNWTDDELEMLRRNWHIKSLMELRKLLHRDRPTIKRKAAEIGLPERLGYRPGRAPWTREMDEKAIAGFKESLFYRDIGALVGVSGDAAKRRLARLGYKHDKAAARAQSYRSLQQLRGPGFMTRTVHEPTPQPEPETQSWTDGVGFFDLKPHHCRWIILGHGAGARFCGEHKMEDQSYCQDHYDRSIRKDQTRALNELNVIAKRVYEKGHYK